MERRFRRLHRIRQISASNQLSNGNSDLREEEPIECELDHDHTVQCLDANRFYASRQNRLDSFESQCFDMWIGNMPKEKKEEFASCGFYFERESFSF